MLKGTPALILAAALALTGCGATTGQPTTSLPTPTIQTAAQQINSRWGLLTAGVAVGMLADNTPVAEQAQITAAEAALQPQIAACAAGSSPTCLPQVQAAIVSFVDSLKLGPKGTAELQIGKGLLATLVPGLAG